MGKAAEQSPKKEAPTAKRIKKKKSKFVNVKRDVRDIKVIKEKELTITDIENELNGDDVADKKEANIEEIQRRSGVVYFSSIPPGFTVSRFREELSPFAKINRIYLQPNKTKKKVDKANKYAEGWVEFESKRKAKDVAEMLCGRRVLGKRRNLAFDSIWTCKYLHGFKWVHLMEQLVYESKVEEQRMRAELSKVKRQAEFFAENVEKGARIKKLEEKVLKKGGLWDKYCRQLDQKKALQEENFKTPEASDTTDLMKLIFDAKAD